MPRARLEAGQLGTVDFSVLASGAVQASAKMHNEMGRSGGRRRPAPSTRSSATTTLASSPGPTASTDSSQTGSSPVEWCNG